MEFYEDCAKCNEDTYGNGLALQNTNCKHLPKKP
jgi:hypothetical protein